MTWQTPEARAQHNTPSDDDEGRDEPEEANGGRRAETARPDKTSGQKTDGGRAIQVREGAGLQMCAASATRSSCLYKSCGVHQKNQATLARLSKRRHKNVSIT